MTKTLDFQVGDRVQHKQSGQVGVVTKTQIIHSETPNGLPDYQRADITFEAGKWARLEGATDNLLRFYVDRYC